jgi:membrane protein implicated in regulation of membrane protease activity
LLFWFILGLAFLVIEVLTPGVMALFFGLGAWLVLLALALFDLPVWGQWALFSVSSILFLAFLRKHVIKRFSARKQSKKDSLEEPMVASRYLGQEVDVITGVLPGRPGQVELNGTLWQAKSPLALERGSRARIVGLEGLTFLIEPLGPLGGRALAAAPGDGPPSDPPG